MKRNTIILLTIILLGTVIWNLFAKDKVFQSNEQTSIKLDQTIIEKEGENKMTVLPQFTEVQGNERLVEMVTNKGSIQIKLFPDQAPKAVENFLTLSLIHI